MQSLQSPDTRHVFCVFPIPSYNLKIVVSDKGGERRDTTDGWEKTGVYSIEIAQHLFEVHECDNVFDGGPGTSTSLERATAAGSGSEHGVRGRNEGRTNAEMKSGISCEDKTVEPKSCRSAAPEFIDPDNSLSSDEYDANDYQSDDDQDGSIQEMEDKEISGSSSIVSALLQQPFTERTSSAQSGASAITESAGGKCMMCMMYMLSHIRMYTG